MIQNYTAWTTSDDEKIPIYWPRTFGIIVFHIIALSAPWFFSWDALAIAIFLHWLCGSIGICLGYHRLLTHHSFSVPKPLEYVIVTIGALAQQGGPLFWVGNHRLHHAFTEDNERDPYSANRGFWWSHMLWLLYPQGKTFDTDAHRKLTPRLAQDPYYSWLDNYYSLLQIPLGLLLYAWGGWSYVIYGIFVRTVVLWHSTWLINSAAHLRGYQTFDNQDDSYNLWWAALLTYGEGWHNNHHATPNIAPAGRQWWEIDVTWWAIVCLEWLGLARGVKRPAAKS